MDSSSDARLCPSCIWLLFVAVATLAIPAGTALTGTDFSVAVTSLSVLAASFELALCCCCGSGGKGQLFRLARRLPLRLGLLYTVQLLLVINNHAVESDAADHISRVAVVPPQPIAKIQSGLLAAKPSPAPEIQTMHNPAIAAAFTTTTQQGVSSNSFQLDASIDSLRWAPKTISVVLPCAEEREYALKTVQSVFAQTPADVLHEIVVVDDGSNPPLSQTHLKPEVQQQYKVKIERHENTVGLIGAKKTGGDAATGDIVVFFDCHVAPQTHWYKDFLELISENYRRMVVPQITGLDIDTWTQQGSGGAMSKCYVTWDGDFKWGGPNDMYMGMLSGGLAGMSKRWWTESGGFDDQMLGWGGENIDQGVRMWVCGGEIVAAPKAQVAHMWRTGNMKTRARYRHVGDTIKNRARAVHAWFGEFAVKLDEFPAFANRKHRSGPHWYGDMSTFEKVKQRLQGCRPFAWYLRRFKAVYEDGGIIPEEIFMIKEKATGRCIRFMGSAGTSSTGHEAVRFENCDESDDRFYWHLGNLDTRTRRCCSGLRAWNTEQCFSGDGTGICEISGNNFLQHWKLSSDGRLKRGDTCFGSGSNGNAIRQMSCSHFVSGLGEFTKEAAKAPVETRLYKKAQQDHPESFKLLNEQLKTLDGSSGAPPACRKKKCLKLIYSDGRDLCISESGELVRQDDGCAAMIQDFKGGLINADNGQCLDSWSDSDATTFGFYGCHGGFNQQFYEEKAGLCTRSRPQGCFITKPWSPN